MFIMQQQNGVVMLLPLYFIILHIIYILYVIYMLQLLYIIMCIDITTTLPSLYLKESPSVLNTMAVVFEWRNNNNFQIFLFSAIPSLSLPEI